MNSKKNIISKNIGKKIYELRTNKKYSREFLAEKTNLSPNYIYEIENGNYTIGCIPLINLCNALEITPTQLLLDFIDIPKKELEEILPLELSDLCEGDSKIILELIKLMKKNKI